MENRILSMDRVMTALEKNTRDAIRNRGRDHAGHQIASDGLYLTRHESERLLDIISQASRIKRHYELFRLLQGDVQFFIPHQILVCAWGDFHGSDLQADVISAIPGVRTGRLDGCSFESELRSPHFRWLAGERRPLVLGGTTLDVPAYPPCNCALHRSLRGMRSILVHGVHDARDGTDILYFAAHKVSVVNGGGVERFGLLADTVIAQIDVAFRKIAGLASPAMPDGRNYAALSAREEEILLLISEGRTNAEIAQTLAISAFTVKNHVQRILKKLGAANRTEAVSKHRGSSARGPRQWLSGRNSGVRLASAREIASGASE